MKNLVLALILISAAISQSVYAKPRIINFISHKTNSETVDVGSTGLSVGDITINSGGLLNVNASANIGSYIARLIIVSVDIVGGTTTRDLLVSYSLPEGTVTTVNMNKFPLGTNFPVESSDRAIIGGTGRYAGVKGVATVTPISGHPDDLMVKLKFK